LLADTRGGWYYRNVMGLAEAMAKAGCTPDPFVQQGNGNKEIGGVICIYPIRCFRVQYAP
jgi:hypothetical protein